MNVIKVLQLIFSLGPGALQIIEAIIAAINSTPGSPEHAAAVAKITATDITTVS